MRSEPLSVYLEGIGLLGPGLNGWSASAPLLADPGRYTSAALAVPVPDCLPPAERRRVGTQIRLTLAVGREAVTQAQRDAASLANVFSASSGDGDNCHAICEALADADRLISPTRFHNSVHNAPAGYWGIAMKCMAPSTSLCAHDGSFAAGLLETAVQARSNNDAALLVCCDAPYPEPLHGVRPLAHGFAVALVLASAPGPRTLARLDLALASGLPSHPGTAALDALCQGNPAARALPLLQALATQHPGPIRLPYLDGCTLAVTLRRD
ncbi:MAG: beta-ketoacyl synthase chain length factor [Hylemonella sp.]|nr:beta-ketoacyl synthase chain length factor [Hylemonella sp.]